MNRSRPMGSLGGGGWESAQAGPDPGTGAPTGERTAGRNKRDKVLADMYEMFLDLMEPEIIQSVVQSCRFNHKNSMEALLDMCEDKSPSNKSSAQPSQPVRNTFQEDSKTPLPTPNPEKPQSLSSGMPRNYPSPGSIPQTPLNLYFPTRKKKSMDPLANDKMNKVKSYIEKKYKIMVIMRGCPGSGKSHLAEGLVLEFGGKPKDYVFSTDDFFMRNNTYVFQPAALHEAHQWNQTRVLGKVREGQSPIIIDNTNTQLWEMTVYASMAINYGYAIEILEPDTPWFTKLEELTKRNKHNVPRDKIRGMLERYESGITLEGLIKSTGAKYSRLPPQLAENPLTTQAQRNENQELLRSTNHRPSGAIRNQGLQNLLPNFSSINNYSTLSSPREPTNLSSPDSKPSLTGGGIFYFGPNTSNQSPNSTQMASSNVLGPFSVLNPSQKSEESNLKSFHGAHKTRIVPLKSKSLEMSDSLIDTTNVTSGSNVSEVNHLESNFSLSSNFNNVDLRLRDPSILAAVQSRNSATFSETVPDHPGSPTNRPTHSSADISTLNSIFDSVPSPSIQDIRDGESKDEAKKPVLNPSGTFDFMSGMKSNENACSFPSLSPLDIVLEETSKAQAGPLIDWMGAADWKVSDKKKSDVQSNSAKSIFDWVGTADLDVSMSSSESTQQKLVPKPARSFSLKNMQDYCQSVKDINAASTSDAGGWSFSENGPVSWQPIDRIQAETVRKEKSLSPQINSQRLKFKKIEVEEKATNTHHADFSVLSSISSNVPEGGVTVLDTHDRDINEGKTSYEVKVPLKLMLDKGTFTENDFDLEMKKENKQEKIKELARLFPNRAPASLKELLKQGNWDVNYVSNLLLDDTDNDAFSTSFPGDGSIDSDSDEESPTQVPMEENDAVAEVLGAETDPVCDSPIGPTAQEMAEEVKRHIEQSIDFSERSYSPHLLAIKNYRRGVREGAIPKSASVVFGEPVASCAELELVNEFKETTPESCQVTSDSSDGDECNETLEFVVGQDFIQQLADKFGGSCNVSSVSPVVKFPVNLARKIHDIIFTANVVEEDEDDGDLAMKLQCEEDERIAHQLYEEMQNNAGQRVESTAPQLREIMDMELAQAIYKADVDLLTHGSQETMANVLAKRLLEDNYSQLDKRTLHNIFASCNYSFEDTVKTLQEALSTDDEVFGEKGRAQREQELVYKAKQASVLGKHQGVLSDSAQYAQVEYESAEDSIENENPWEVSDPKGNYNRYREKADQYLKERDEMYRKANDAFRRKQRSVAAYYARLGELHGKKYHHASAMAAAALAVAQADTQTSDTLDLHHFKVVEAVIVFDLFIDHQIRLLSERGVQQECLSIITGRGSHSVNGKPKIKPAVLSRAKKRGLRCQALQNPGVIRVWVTAESRPSHQIPD